ncbi:MAG TPA: TAXI family TRAP transporter solute-binding subunit [Kiritimatiellia bacterium]|nr:TAXI family TRAP transporter solute-binding subunit [Kiritimatiellia bacterium]
MKTPIRILAFLFAATFLAACGGSSTGTHFATIGTGGVTGVYYPVGGAIARLVNQNRDHAVRMSVESTGGSIFNLNAVASGQIDLGMAQADLHHQAWNGLGPWDGQPIATLRSVLALHPEIVTLMVADDTGIRDLADLRGRHINLGNPGSGNRANALDVLRAAGLDPQSDLRPEALSAAEAPRLVQDNRLDGFFYTVGHPNGAISEATSGRRTMRFLPIPSQDLVAAFPYYTPATLPIDLYPMAANQEDVPSIGVATTLITSSDVPDHVIYAVVHEVLTHFDTFRQTHPALANLQPSDLLNGLTSPLHPGAQRAFQQAGLLPSPSF